MKRYWISVTCLGDSALDEEEADDGPWVKYDDAHIAVADALDKHQHLMDHYMALKARVAKMEEAIGKAIPNCISNRNVAELEVFVPDWRDRE